LFYLFILENLIPRLLPQGGCQCCIFRFFKLIKSAELCIVRFLIMVNFCYHAKFVVSFLYVNVWNGVWYD